MQISNRTLLIPLIGISLFSTPPTAATDKTNTSKNLALEIFHKSWPKKAVYTALFCSFVRFNSRKATNEPSKCSFKRLKNSITGSLNAKNNKFTCAILGYDLARSEKKELTAIVIGVRNAKEILIPFAKISVPKADRAALKKNCEKLLLNQTPLYAHSNPTIRAKHWITPELTCTVKFFALARSSEKSKLSYTAIDPNFDELSENQEVTTESLLAHRYAEQSPSAEITAQEILNMIDDGLIGHAAQSAAPCTDLETGKHVASEGAPAKGIYGHAWGYWKPSVGATLMLGVILAIQEKTTITDALFDLKKAKENLLKSIGTVLTNHTF